MARAGPAARGGALAAAALLLVAVALAAAGMGSVRIPVVAVALILAERLGGPDLVAGVPGSWATIIWELRLPRVLMGGLVGMGLASSGAVFQGVLRNPLADPFLLGVSAGAALAAALTLGLGWAWPLGAHALPVTAFGGALGATALIYLVARTDGRVPIGTLILAGVALGAFLSSITSFVLFRAAEAFRTFQILAFLMGSLALAGWSRLSLLIPYLAVGLVGAVTLSRALNVLLLGEEQAQHLGLPVEPLKLLLIGLAALLAAASVAGAGIVGFVGLIVPHAVRLLWGPDHRFLVPMSALLGGSFLILCDLLARTLFSPAELPVGVVTAFFGAPFFLYLLRQRKGVVAP